MFVVEILPRLGKPDGGAVAVGQERDVVAAAQVSGPPEDQVDVHAGRPVVGDVLDEPGELPGR